MNTPSPCYKFSRSVVGEHVPLDNLRLELSPTRFCFLSYHHLDMAIFESATDRDTLTISFLNHQVRIAGTNLRELAVAIQGRAVEVIKPMPGRYNAGAGSGIGLVESIEVETNTQS